MRRRDFIKSAPVTGFSLVELLKNPKVSAQAQQLSDEYLDKLAIWELGSGDFQGMTEGKGRMSGYTATKGLSGEKLLYRNSSEGIGCWEQVPSVVNFLGNVKLQYNGEEVHVDTLAPIAFTRLFENNNGLDDVVINNPNISSYLVFKQENPLLWNYVDMIKIHDDTNSNNDYISIIFDDDRCICGTGNGIFPVIEKDDGLNMRLLGYLINSETGERLVYGRNNIPTVMEIDGKKYLFSSQKDNGEILMALLTNDLSCNGIKNVVDANGNIPHDFTRNVTINNGKDLIDGKRTLLLGDGWASFQYLTKRRETTAVEEQKDQRPSEYKILENYPNPFNPSTSIEYYLDKEQNVTLEIRNLAGQHVVTLEGATGNQGLNSVVWDGKTKGGLYTPSGLYFSRLKIGNKIVSDKMLKVK